MPGGEAERFGQSQSRVHGLVVRQLGNGNLAGSASAINATALRESDVKDLLFTFNQNVGPMMGGSLEEVIKFLRIRYERERDKIPAGYKIDLGFQNKYVPKDGPSAAAAFALVLDSLFSGEELDDDFACTGDMTSDRIGTPISAKAPPSPPLDKPTRKTATIAAARLGRS
jgi:ATP-dependent Lon protease